MIEIHRHKPVVYFDKKPVKLTRNEHSLIVALGMMDNKIVPHDILLDAICEGRVQIPADKDVLLTKMSRLKSKLGNVLLNKRNLGYGLCGDVRFTG